MPLTKEGQFDPNGTAVAFVDIEEVHDWRPSEVHAACSSNWEPGYWAWSLSNVRPISNTVHISAHRKLYEIQAPEELLYMLPSPSI